MLHGVQLGWATGASDVVYAKGVEAPDVRFGQSEIGLLVLF